MAGLVLHACLGVTGQSVAGALDGAGVGAATGRSGEGRSGLPVQWRVMASPRQRLRVGQEFTAVMQATVTPGWHLYALAEEEDGPVSLEPNVRPAGPVVLVSVGADRPERGTVSGGIAAAHFYEGRPRFRLRLRGARASKAAGPAEIAVRFQACNDRMCLPPRTVTLPLPVSVGPGAP